jgi:hypothetical protein
MNKETMMKKRTTALAALALAGVTLFGAASASAAVITPTGDKAPGADSFCYYPQGQTSEPNFEDNICSAIPGGTWGAETIPVGSAGPAGAYWEDFKYVSSIVTDGTVTQSDDPTAHIYERSSLVAPSDLTTTPFIGTGQLQVMGQNPEFVEVKAVRAVGVADAEGFSNPNPTAGQPGQRENIIAPGSTFPVELTETGELTYEADFIVPSPTWVHKTDGALNAFGYAGHFTVIIDAVENGVPVIYTQNYSFDFYSDYQEDAQAFISGSGCPDGDICAGTGAISLNGSFGTAAAQPPVAEVPVEEVPVVEVPTPEAPAPVEPTDPINPAVPEAPEADEEAVYPRVNTGGEASYVLATVFGIFAAVIGVGGATALFYARRNRSALG